MKQRSLKAFIRRKARAADKASRSWKNNTHPADYFAGAWWAFHEVEKFIAGKYVP